MAKFGRADCLADVCNALTHWIWEMPDDTLREIVEYPDMAKLIVMDWLRSFCEECWWDDVNNLTEEAIFTAKRSLGTYVC